MEEKKHIVMAAFPAQGHLNPMLILANSIISHTPEYHITLVHNSDQTPPPTDSSVRMVSIPEGSFPADELKGSSSGFVSMMKAAREMQNPLERVVINLQNDGKVVCIISDSLMGWNQDVADRLGVPLVCLWTASAAACVMNFQVMEILDSDYIPVGEKLLKYGNIPLDAIPGLANFHLADLPFGFYDDDSVQAVAPSFSRMKEAACILVNTVESLEERSMQAMRMLHPKAVAIGLTMDVQSNVQLERGECLEWLDKQVSSSVIYISFGTLANLSAVQLEEIAAGLETAGAPFLWALRTDLAEDGYGASFEEFLERTRTEGRNMVVPWAPQVEVLNHPSTGLFLSHCGWNSTIEGMSAGVPFLTWPCIAEQNVNAGNIVHEWKVGLELWEREDGPGRHSKKIVTREKIKESMFYAMKDQELRENGKRLQKLLTTPRYELATFFQTIS